MTGDSRSALIEQYRRGHAEVVQALEAVTAGELDQRRAPTEWSIREIVHHLADSEMIAALRLRRLLAESPR
jgi:DinB superfamily